MDLNFLIRLCPRTNPALKGGLWDGRVESGSM